MSASLLQHLRDLPGRTRRLDAGAPVFQQDDPVRVMHLVLEGEVHLLRRQSDGGVLVQQRARAGALLAEASLFADRYHCAGVAALPAQLLVIRRTDLRAHLARSPAASEALAAHLAREVQAARLRAEILSLRTVSARLDAWIAAHDGNLPPKGEWKGIAAEIATSPEALYRELARRPRPKRPAP